MIKQKKRKASSMPLTVALRVRARKLDRVVRETNLDNVREYLAVRNGWNVPRIDSALKGLRLFVQIIRDGHRIRPPTRDIDSAWHAWLLFTRDYISASRRIFDGRILCHLPKFDDAGPNRVLRARKKGGVGQ